ncbi:MAG: phosphotransferase [Mycobacterium sp.]
MPVTRIERPDDLTADWLTAAIGAGTVERFGTERIGTGQMSECYRVALTYADGAEGPESVVLKVAATDPASRQTGLALGLYEREVRFYTDLAPGIGGPVAPCYSSALDSETGVFHLLLGDAAPAVVGDEIRGATTEQAMLAMSELGRLHAPLLGQSAMADVEWLNREAPMNQALIAQLYAGFIDRYGAEIAPAHREVCERLVASFDAYHVDTSEFVHGLVHGDYRLDNMLFGQPGAARPLTVVDWQTVTWGPAMIDVAYFLGCALPDDVRRDKYDALLGAYHDALGPDAALSVDEVREGVRRQAFFGVMMAIVSPMLVARTERGDEMFMTMLRRHSQHVIDTDALATLPEPTVPEALQPSADDEGVHQPGAEPLWSESWYADFVDEAQGIGGWFRLGLIPNEDRAWVNALLCGPDIPTVAVNDFQVAPPDDPGVIRTDAFELSQSATDPLQTYHVRLRGSGQAYDDPSSLLRGEPGRAVELSMDLHWTTVGTPYQYRITSRYEIPCTVSGTVTFDGRTVDVRAVPGQRDHSWGARDWWGMDWVWSALHLSDGTHLHGVDIRIPGAPPIGIGYIQPPDGPLVELQAVTAQEVFGDNGLPVTTELTLNPGDVVASVCVKGNAPVLLPATDGRVSQFPRAWATVTTADGRTGVGWVEWNRNAR